MCPPCRRAGISLLGAHCSSCQTELLAASTAIPSFPPLRAGLTTPCRATGQRGFRFLSFLCCSPSWLLPFSCLSTALGTLAPWEVDSTLGGFVTLKAALPGFSCLLYPVSNLEISGSTTTWLGGSSRDLCLSSFPLSPSLGLAGLWSFLRSWKHQGALLRARKSFQKLDVALWKEPAPFAWEPRWEVLRKPKYPALGPSAPLPCPTSPRCPCVPTCCSRNPQGCWVT